MKPQRLKLKNILNKLLILIAFLIVVSIVYSSRLQTLRNSQISGINQAYIKALSCTTSIPPPVKNAPNVDKCWQAVERDTGVKLIRYDTKIDWNE